MRDTSPYFILTLILVAVVIFFSASPNGRTMWNSWFFQVQKADDATNYTTLKTVEDTCRATMADYTKAVLMYEQYRNSTNKDERAIAMSAQIRANSAAASYNEYIKKNSFVWKGGIPPDLQEELAYVN